MASLRTPTPIEGGGMLMTILKIPACVTGDTVYVSGPVKTWDATNTTTADAVTATYSTTTSLFTIVVANTPDVHLWVWRG
jgi:hypothetical protein